VVGERNLSVESVVGEVLRQQWEEVEPQRGIPVEELGVGMVSLELLVLHRVVAYNLALEIIISAVVLGVHHRGGGVSLDGILEHAPVGVVAVDDAGSHVEVYGEETALCGVAHRCACAVFLTFGAQVDTMGIAVVGANAVV